MKLYLFLSIGAIAGAICRYQLGVWVSGMNGGSIFPWATFIINVSGSLLLGFLMRYLIGTPSSPEARILLTTGFCGAYTTFSTFSYEAVNLLIEGQTSTALAYAASSVVIAPGACFLGYVIAGLVL
jgi:CrcB protein